MDSYQVIEAYERSEQVKRVDERYSDNTGEQRALYTRAKRRGAALPDQVKLKRKRQRTGIQTTR